MEEPDAKRLVAEVGDVLDALRVGSHAPVALESELQRDLGLDSLALVELQERIERAFGIRLDEEVLATATTVGDWLAAITAARRAPVPEARAAPRAPVPEARAAPLAETVAPAEEAAAARVEAVAPPAEAVGPAAARTIVAALAAGAAAAPEKVAVRVLGPGGRPAAELTYGALAATAGRIAAGLVAEGVGVGERVAIMLPTGVDFFGVFLGIQLARCVPVPIYPPATRSMLEEHLRRQAGVLRNASARALVTVAEARVAGALLRAEVPTLRSVLTPEDLQAASGLAPSVAATEDDVALVQYTSGSTAAPKGVVLTHGQLVANITAMGEAAQVSESDVFVSWLPLYHDMGLIGAFLAPLWFGFPLVVSSPLAFLARPGSWLEAIGEHRGTLSAAPNVAFQLCVDRVSDAEAAGIDLSSLRLVFNGSEPVAARTLEAFTSRFAGHGFRPEAMCPAYGLAEVGVGVTFSPLGRGPRVDAVSRDELRRAGRADPVDPGAAGARLVVSCGVPLPGYEVRVTDPHGRELPDRREGAVSCRGPSATAGYLASPEATRTLWRGGWLETGDVGYVADGELFLTGRAKDVVIRAGRNLHPEELEEALGGVPGVRRGGAAVVAATDERLGTERLVAVVETDLEDDDARRRLGEDVRRRAVEEVGVALDEVVVTRAGALPRTPSGKLRRHAARKALEEGTMGREPPPFGLQVVRLGLAGLAALARRLAGDLGTVAFSAYAWTVVAVVVAPLWLAMLAPSTAAFRWRLVRAAGRLLVALTGIPVSVAGPASPLRGPAVIVANHASFVDGLVLILALPDPAVIVTSTDLGRKPLVGRFLERLGCVLVERGTVAGGKEATAALVRLLRRGARLVVFPEGSITRAPGLRPFRLGAFAAAVASGSPVVPVGISGSRGVVRPGTYLVRRGAVRVTFSPPLVPGGRSLEAQVQLRDAARAAVARASGEPVVLQPLEGG